MTTTSGGLGEVEVGGPSLSIIPKSGGNTLRGAAYLSGVTKRMVDSNYTDEPGPRVDDTWEAPRSSGISRSARPIMKDRVCTT